MVPRSPTDFPRGRRFWASIFVALVLALGGAAIVWKISDPKAKLERWLEKTILQAYQDAMGPSPPIELTEVRVSADLVEAAKGKVSSIRLLFRKSTGGMTVRISGPLQLDQKLLPGSIGKGLLEGISTDVRARYSPTLSISLAAGTGWTFPEIELDVIAVANPREKALKSLEVLPRLSNWNGNPHHVGIESPEISLRYDDAKATLEFAASSVTLQPSDERATRVGGIKASIIAQESDDGPMIDGRITAESAEALWGDSYVEVPLSSLPLGVSVRGVSVTEKSGVSFETATLEIGSEGKSLASARLRPDKERASLNWEFETTDIPLMKLWDAILTLFSEGSYDGVDRLRNGIQVTGGSARLEARGRLNGLEAPDLEKFSGALSVRGGRLSNSDRTIEVSGMDVSLPLDSTKSTTGKIKASAIRYRRLQGGLDPWNFVISPSPSPTERFRFRLAAKKGPEMRFDGLPWRMGPVQASFGLGEFSVGTSEFHVGPVSVTRLAEPLCLSRHELPDAVLEVALGNVKITPDALMADGKAEARLFDGYLRVSDPRLYAPLSAVPEAQFSAKWDRIRLDRMGAWTGFGEMQGIIRGHAKNVVIQGWLPTQYDFKVELKPLGKGDVEFSTRAVENMVLVLSGEDFRANIPGIARFFMVSVPDFFWPDFTIKWAGVRLLARDGWVLIEDLTPEAYLNKGERRGEGQRYFVYGTRVTVPFKASNYPVVLDASAVANYTRNMAAYFQRIRETRHREERAAHEKSPQGASNNDVSSLCIP